MNAGNAYTNGRIVVDLHRRLHRPGTSRTSTDELLNSTSVVDCSGSPTRLMAPGDAFMSLVLVMARDLFSVPNVNALRVVEMTLVAGYAGDECLDDCREQMVEWRAVRIFDRARELVDWARGGDRPEWADPALGDYSMDLPLTHSRWGTYARRSRLVDGPSEAIRYLAQELGTMGWRALTWRRGGRW